MPSAPTIPRGLPSTSTEAPGGATRVSLAAPGVVFAAGVRTVRDLPDLSDLLELAEPMDPAELATDLLFSFLTGAGSFLGGVGASRPVGFCAKAFCARTSTENRAARSVS